MRAGLGPEGTCCTMCRSVNPYLATSGPVKSEMKTVSRVSDDHTEEEPTEVQSALPRPQEINAPDKLSPRWAGCQKPTSASTRCRTSQLARPLLLAERMHRDINGCYYDRVS